GPFGGAPMVLLTALAVVLGALNIPAMNARLGPADSAESMPAVRELVSELAPLRAERGGLVDLQAQRFAGRGPAPREAWGARRPAGPAVRRAVQRPRHARARAARCPLVRGRPRAAAP